MARTASDLEPPECSQCGIEMDHAASGTEKSVPLVGSAVEYERFSCPECGQGVRFERADPDDEWTQAGV